MKNFQWLHFSDLHLCSDNGNAVDARKSLVKFVEAERKAGRLKFDYIFITGDVADKAKYDQSESYLKELFTALGLKITKRSLSKVFWAVGNHDIGRSETSKRSDIIRKIRNPDEKYSLSDGLDEKNSEDSGLLLDSGMLPYKDKYKLILKRDLEATAKKPHILKEFPELNIVILNTCITSADDNDTHNLYIQTKHLKRVFESIHDRNKPLFVIGHHGRDFFYMDEMYALSDVFDEMGVDVYLCGHNHKLGVALFPDTQRDIYQFTCGGGPSFSTKTNFSFMHGAFDCSDCSIQITPYSYRVDGDKEWSIDEHLSRRLKPSTRFKLERLCSTNNSVRVESSQQDCIEGILSYFCDINRVSLNLRTDIEAVVVVWTNNHIKRQTFYSCNKPKGAKLHTVRDYSFGVVGMLQEVIGNLDEIDKRADCILFYDHEKHPTQCEYINDFRTRDMVTRKVAEQEWTNKGTKAMLAISLFRQSGEELDFFGALTFDFAESLKEKDSSQMEFLFSSVRKCRDILVPLLSTDIKTDYREQLLNLVQKEKALLEKSSGGSV